ncbi:hypothetical protein HBH89_241610 [Parastagonospora nodorum]|nr:hypothetical protein HBH91_246680 [Parastagonospora nodorum]KAH4482316.1 hypothetical protein HBH89_241610 [Parastagonospora nodorum]KAH4652990.1 hypothetical protein HBH80_187370 [Parastagonospora nodorum]KAH5097516.1 hypothetical protein HBH71_247530 [Parastagonospora nodorum]
MLKNKLFYSFLSSLLSLLLLKLYNLIDRLTANKLPYLVPIVLLKKILLIAIRIYYCVILCYLVYKHSCLLAYCSLIYIRIISKDKLLGFNSIKGNITQSSKVKYLLDYRMFNDSYNNSNSNSNIKI